MFIRPVKTSGMFIRANHRYNKNAALYWVRQGIIQTLGVFLVLFSQWTHWPFFMAIWLIHNDNFICRVKWPVVTNCFLSTPACPFFFVVHFMEEALQFIKCVPKECCSITLLVKGLFLHHKLDKASISNTCLFLRFFGAIIHYTVFGFNFLIPRTFAVFKL